ncbi:hypothetical protein BDA96_02G256900 [Sorghum bicolor]|uniref:Uncharacterized protein n=3 Tax=Andropogoneae TaxID=147429 RepID=A0A921RSD0_SORBI|nr:uncharacterized protein LOC8055866 [Sorghum bicolor]EER96966.1 hypothetical protein SORBI_3002G245600 [Sorghum bicolor]KAG0544222.1 hypothetical protein BDA96_02G256900 [Sorghum bicolor]|eukprot:XP_002460445.1 uncharacterized protein LOC8055866 [Sorghum bicolor]
MASSPLAPTRTYSPLVPKLPRPSPPSPCSSPRRSARWPRSARARATPGSNSSSSSSSTAAATEEQKRCLRCGGVYRDEENHPTACAFHGHITGEKGLFSMSPPHQGIDGEWSDKSGIIVYRWNDEGSRPNTGRANWKKRWSCCQEREEDAPPCQRGWHVSYDDGYTLF